MNQTIWTCWLQGRAEAPRLVERCIQSWEERNPGWDVRVLDQAALPHYIDLPELAGKTVSRPALSDIVRLLVLAEYGGVWTDATVYCVRPLDDWLPPRLGKGFFAFDKPGGNRPLSTWFLSAEVGAYLVDRWCERTLAYWTARTRAHEYFWCHGLFRELCEAERSFQEHWDAVPKISADGPHLVQRLGMFRTDIADAERELDPDVPVYKLSRRHEPGQYRSGTFVWHLIEPKAPHPQVGRQQRPLRRAISAIRNRLSQAAAFVRPRAQDADSGQWTFASLKVSTKNLGDHIQIIAGKRLLQRAGVEPSVHIDRDRDIATCRAAPPTGRIALLLNGWFKTDGRQWPPHERIRPMFLGFHMRPAQCPELLSVPAIRYYQRHGPIGCRDPYTRHVLESRGVACFESNCLSLSFRRRTAPAGSADTVFAVSRDERLCDVIPTHARPVTFVSHYSDTNDYDINEQRALALLDRYRTDAKLIITTLLHCALPAIAMGIPVVVFYPANDKEGHASDEERFSGLAQIVPIHSMDDVSRVDWNSRPVDVSAHKLRIIDQFRSLADRWPLPEAQPSRSTDILS